MMRRAMVALAVMLLAGCSSDPYPLPAGPGASVSNPVRVGHTVPTVLVFITLHPGDRIEFLGAEPLGSFDGASVRLLLSRPVPHASGEVMIGEAVETLEGAEFAAPPAPSGVEAGLNTVGIVGELTAGRPGRFEVTSVRLRYRMNGGGERTREAISVVWLVCADDPAPADCDE